MKLTWVVWVVDVHRWHRACWRCCCRRVDCFCITAISVCLPVGKHLMGIEDPSNSNQAPPMNLRPKADHVHPELLNRPMFILPLPLMVSSACCCAVPFGPFGAEVDALWGHTCHATHAARSPETTIALDGQKVVAIAVCCVGNELKMRQSLMGGEYLGVFPSHSTTSASVHWVRWGWYLPFFPPSAPFSPPLSSVATIFFTSISTVSTIIFIFISTVSAIIFIFISTVSTSSSSPPSGAIPCRFSLRIALRGGGSSSGSGRLGAWGRCFIIRCMLAFSSGVKPPAVDDVFPASFRIISSVFFPFSSMSLLRSVSFLIQAWRFFAWSFFSFCSYLPSPIHNRWGPFSHIEQLRCAAFHFLVEHPSVINVDGDGVLGASSLGSSVIFGYCFSHLAGSG